MESNTPALASKLRVLDRKGFVCHTDECWKVARRSRGGFWSSAPASQARWLSSALYRGRRIWLW